MRKILLALIAVSGILVSCSEDFLNPQPTNAVSDDQIFSSVEAANTALNSAYSYVGLYYTMTLGTVMSEVMGEDAAMSSGAYGFPTYNWNLYSYTYSQVAASEPWWFGYANYIWPSDYKGIDAVNSVLANEENLPEGEDKDELIAQAHGVRGFLYLRLIRLFAPTYTINPEGKGVILRTGPANAASEHIGRASIKDVYTQIIADLSYAEQNCKGTNQYFINSKAAALLLARAYLDMADYSNAKTYAEKAAGNTFDGSNLCSKEEWRSGFKNPNGEWLWGFNYNENTSNYYASIPSFYYLADSDTAIEYGGQSSVEGIFETGENLLDGYSTVRWTKRFVDSFEEGDCRKLFPFYFYAADGYLTSKFSHRGTIGDADFPMARIAEAYLIKAECEAQAENAGIAKNVLNALQTKRGASATEGTLENIYYERRKELYGEGFRLQDIKRLHQPLDRTRDPEHWAEVKSLPADSPRFMLPIPEVEMLYNSELKASDQNEFWAK